jgi:hypothetical protein
VALENSIVPAQSMVQTFGTPQRGLEEIPDPISRPENGSSSFAPVSRHEASNDEGRRAHSCSSAAFFSGGEALSLFEPRRAA